METEAPWPERLWQGFLDLLFPPRCVACRRPGSWLCPDCLSRVGRVEGPVCERCGRPLPRPGVCASCRADGLALECVRAPFFFEGALQRAVHELKYRGRRVFAGPLGELLGAYVASLGWPDSALVPVPLHADRERARGYNQAALVARVVAGRVGWPLLERGLVRVRNTRPQVGLDRQARRENVAQAFRWEGPAPPLRVVLVDDVYTTGATMEACAQALRQAGVGEVRGIALARPRFDPPGRVP